MQAQQAAYSDWIRYIHAAPIPMWAMRGESLIAANSAALLMFGAVSIDDLDSAPQLRELQLAGGDLGWRGITRLDGRVIQVQVAGWLSNDGLQVFQTAGSDWQTVAPDGLSELDLDWINHCRMPGVEQAQSAELRRGLMVSSADCIKLISLDGRLQYMNPGGRELMAVKDFEAVQGADWLGFWEGEHRAAAESAVRQAKEGGVGRFIGRCARMNGELRWWDVVVTPARDAQGRIQRLLCISRDVTDIKQAQLQESLERGVLESIADNAPLDQVLNEICGLAEFAADGVGRGSVFVVLGPQDPELQVAAAPGLPILVGRRIARAHALQESGQFAELQRLTGATAAVRVALDGPDGLPLGVFVFWVMERAGPHDPELAAKLESSVNLASIALARSSHLQRLRTKQDRLQAISRAAPVGIYQVNASGVVVYSNERLEKITGLTAAQRQGDGWLAGVHPDDREMLRAMWSGARARREEFSAEYRLLPGDGPERWVLTLETPLGDEYLGSTTDITDLKAAQAALAESAGRFQTLANNMSQLCWMADSTGSLFWYNDRWYEFTGTTFEQMQGWGWRAVHHPDHVDRVVEKVSRNWQTGEVWEDTFPLRGKDGNYRWFLSRALPIRDAEGRVQRWFGTNTDITEQRQLEAAMQRQNLALQRSNEDLSRFAFVASHDLQEPVRSIVTFAQLLQRSSGAVLDDKSSGYLDSIIHAGTRMHRLIRDLLLYAQASAESEQQPVDVDLNRVYAGVLQNLRTSVEEAGASIACESPLPVVCAVEMQVTQVLQNLLSNAIKYRREGVPPVVRISSRREASHWRISIQDNGRGFPAEYSSHVFEFLKRLHGRDVAGSGIGLAVCKTFVERCGGEIGAESVPGEGSTFWFTLPATRGCGPGR